VAVLGNGGMAVDSAANLYVIDNGKWGGETAGGLTPPLQSDAELCERICERNDAGPLRSCETWRERLDAPLVLNCVFEMRETT
jgi:hypothetical protein